MIRLWILFLMGILMISCAKEEAVTPIPEMYVKHSIYDIENAKNTKRAILVGQDRYYESGILANGKKEGPWIYYYEKAGTPKIVANYENDTLNGPYTEYYEMGWIKVMTNCKGGEFHGDYKEYTESILTKSQTFVEGKLEGEAITYYPDTGMNMSRLNYKDGKQHGTATYYDEKGMPTQEYTYENGGQVSSKEFK